MLQTDRRHIVPKARSNGQPKTGTIQLCKFLQMFGNANSYFNANVCLLLFYSRFNKEMSASCFGEKGRSCPDVKG